MDQAVFLDRDGTLGGDGGFCHPDAFTLYREAPHAIKRLNDAGLMVIVITNQSRIAHGETTLAQVNACFERLQAELAAYGAHLDAWYVCPHTLKDNCTCRKPRPDLLQQAARDFDLDLQRSYMVGDGGRRTCWQGLRPDVAPSWFSRDGARDRSVPIGMNGVESSQSTSPTTCLMPPTIS